VQITKCEITVSLGKLEGTDTRASGMRGIFSSPAEVTGIFGV
jgi:hypothetical protein